jgi:hypothetical protein
MLRIANFQAGSPILAQALASGRTVSPTFHLYYDALMMRRAHYLLARRLNNVGVLPWLVLLGLPASHRRAHTHTHTYRTRLLACAVLERIAVPRGGLDWDLPVSRRFLPTHLGCAAGSRSRTSWACTLRSDALSIARYDALMMRRAHHLLARRLNNVVNQAGRALSGPTRFR